ncbi:hypothetical protein A2291_08610 [candidate division WOR-1 bacterium RIFOXYB2_FULL_42_35]|uniref:Nucleotidyltransferase n=1 Tax=candidate division WOR-1 bacterium RIFOXYC2_FULL_41_25 TaxID=1802586 RepID=A0A1F4TLM9_UNCSA|nr:MAG: hypothetical protein A2291_08610 [candidate division WOR-1 bacterium RIFOXYB2_FULL_42_35]OGC23069.1 MAG: hypothetical protein A2247_08510 [candidate division WOR-1 bacterium RIFOXYA2_FULL_41_14]OGC33641.1 MAG: hypothetical protein A2462_02200 [candidate division WOR-1 bacterium RIFOXYC2_FULL_41_25]OGC43604.1 MAG: hypothetical protein A2548_02290 [candidate division WOR-1 bacterium RIFOXYD2_FULL_41_8]
MIEKLRQRQEEILLPESNPLLQAKEKIFVYFRSLLRDEAIVAKDFTAQDWQEYISLASSQGLLQLTYWKTKHLPEPFHPPKEIFEQLRQAFMANYVKFLQTEQQLKVLCGAFNTAGIKVLLLKGPAFAQSIYPHPALRSFSDIDILVNPENVTKTKAVLRQLDYQSHTQEFEHFQGLRNEESFSSKGKTPALKSIDLHWDIHCFFGILKHVSVKDYFDNSISITTPQLAFLTLNPVDALIHAAVHMRMTHHGSFRLSWVADMAMLIKQLISLDDWQRLKRKSQDIGATLVVGESLKLAEFFFGTGLPADFIKAGGWPKATKRESIDLNHAIRRNQNNLSWLLARWPRRLHPLKQIILFGNLLAERLGPKIRR